jgi:methylisocitrate lyase
MTGLSALLARKKTVVVPGVYDALSAHIAHDLGFDALYLTGAGLSVSYLGRPDEGLLTLDEVAGTAARIAGVIPKPLIVDADTGFGGVINVRRTVRELEEAGAAAMQIEDQMFPKRCGHLPGKSVVKAEDMIEKIKAAVAVRRRRDFLIIARTDARAVFGLKDALRRAEAYKRAGADIIFPEALETEAEFKAFGRKKNLGVLMANMTEFGRSPAFSASELAHLGYRLALFPMTAFRAAAFAMKKALTELKRSGTSRNSLSQMQTRAELYKLIGYSVKK